MLVGGGNGTRPGRKRIAITSWRRHAHQLSIEGERRARVTARHDNSCAASASPSCPDNICTIKANDKMAPMTLRWPRTLRTAMLLGFGVTFGVWLFVGTYFAHRIAEVGRNSEAINARYTRSQELLSTMRAQVLLGSVYLRDALLDPDPRTATDYKRQIGEAYRLADEALQQYRPVVDSPEARERMVELRRELDEFHGTLSEILSTDSRGWVLNARTLLRDRIVPKRQVVIRLSEDVQALNRNAFVQQQAGVAAFYAAAERQIWESLGL